MFVGHYSAALAAKAAEPKAPLWTLVAGCQLIDIGWSVLIMTGVEHGRVDPDLPGSPLVLDYMPWTHSLPAAIVWSAAAMLAAKYLLRLGWPAAMAVAFAVASHWLLDLLVHRPDLELFPGGPKAGFALWNHPVIEEATEIGLVAIAGVAWTGSRVRRGLQVWPAAAFVTFLVVLQIVALLLPSEPAATLAGSGPSALAVYLVAAALAALIDRGAARSAQT
ncbi:MAG: hypothetical protein GC155_11070 [Alphaproteobacteria bacterium]|nr:hypothetical protein [Alphaproteobacteria bacterium]